MQRICKIFVHQDVHVLQWRQHWQELLLAGFAVIVKPSFYFKVLSENEYSGCCNANPFPVGRGMDVPAQRALSHVEPAGFAGKAPGYVVLFLSQCCSPKLLWKFLFIFNAGAGQAALNCRHVTQPGCPSGLWIFLALVNALLPLNSSWMSFWMINLKQNHSSGQLPFCLGSGERL